MLEMFSKAGQTNPNNQYWQLWQQHNHPIELSSNKMIDQRLEYLHMNPVKAGFVDKPEDWLFSSAKNYAGLGSMLTLERIT